MSQLKAGRKKAREIEARARQPKSPPNLDLASYIFSLMMYRRPPLRQNR